MAKKLKPCPFCGTQPGRMGVHIVEETVPIVDGEQFYLGNYVRCACCGARSGSFDDKETAVEFWNEREGEDE